MQVKRRWAGVYDLSLPFTCYMPISKYSHVRGKETNLHSGCRLSAKAAGGGSQKVFLTFFVDSSCRTQSAQPSRRGREMRFAAFA